MRKVLPVSRQAINAFMSAPGYRPLTVSGLARALSLDSSAKRDLRFLLRELQAEGKATCLRKNRWAIGGQTRTDLIGRVSLRSDGACWVKLDPESGKDAEFRIGLNDRLNALPGDRVIVSPIREPGRPPRARILRIVERTREIVVGLLDGRSVPPHVVPDEAGLPRVRLSGTDAEHAAKWDRHKVVVRLLGESHGRDLTGELEEVLGPDGAPGVDMLCLMRRREYRQDFPPDVRTAARRVARAPSAEDLRGRLDLRGLFTVTIDPETARDFDDAVSLEQEPDGSWRLGVHIADVGHFVTPGDAVDREALRRGNTVYLVDRAILMLPPELTAETCSLVPQEDRLVRSVLLHLAPDGSVLRAETQRAVIHSRARLSYPQAQAVLEGRETDLPAPVIGAVKKLGDLARLLRERRIAEGALDFQVPELECRLDRDGRIVSFGRRDGSPAYAMIEECMLLANEAVARRLLDRAPRGLFRIHDEPDAEQWIRMAAELDSMGFPLSAHSRGAINRISRRSSGSPLKYSLTLAVLRNLKRATYCEEVRPHFGLAMEAYTHFTSPIRRYPDLVVHRLLDAAERGLPPPYRADELSEIAAHCSATERAADAAAAESVEVKRLQYYAEALRTGRTGPYAAVVTGLVPPGLLVEIPETLLRGLVPFSLLPDRPRLAAGGRTRSRGKRPSWGLGDSIDVELLRVDTDRRRVDFRPAGARRSGAQRKRHRIS
jgi:ribonuclease R